MKTYKLYSRKQHTWARRYEPDEDMTNVSVTREDRENGSPREGDYICVNPENPEDRWLQAEKYFLTNMELIRHWDSKEFPK